MRDAHLWRHTLPLLLQAHAEVDDAELLRRYRTTHDAAAFELLVHRHGPLVWATALRVVRHTATAEDVFQATFWALAQHHTRLRRLTTLAGWLHRVAVRASIDALRRLKPTAPLLDLPGPADPATLVQATDTQQHLDAAINRLPEKLRLPFVLCVLHDHTASDAAKLLGVPVGTVESRVSRAKQRLRETCATLCSGLVAVPASLLTRTLEATTTRSVSPLIHTLAKHATPIPKLLAPTLALVMLTSVVALALGMGQKEQPPPTPPAKTPMAKAEPPAKTPDVEPLPEGAIARFGSTPFRFGCGPGAMRFAPDGRALAVSDGNAVLLVDTVTGKKTRVFTLPDKHTAGMLRFFNEGKQLSLAAMDSNQSVQWHTVDLTTGQARLEGSFKGKQHLYIADFLPDCSRCLVASSFERIFLWDRTTQQEVWSVKHDHTGAPQFFAKGKQWLYWDHGSNAEIRDTATGTVVQAIPSAGPKLQFFTASGNISEAGQRGFSKRASKEVIVLHADGKTPPQSYETKRELYQVNLSPSGRFMVATQTGGTLIWDLHAKEKAAPVVELPAANSYTFSPDESQLALGSDGLLTLWNTKTWQQTTPATDRTTAIDRVQFSPDGVGVLVHTQRGWQRWEKPGGAAIPLLDDKATPFNRTTIVSANGTVGADIVEIPHLDSDRHQYVLRVSNFTTKKSVHIPQRMWAFGQPQLSADGRSLGMAVEDGSVRIWNTTTGTPTTTLPATQGRNLHGFALAADGQSVTHLVTSIYGKHDDPNLAGFKSPMFQAVYVTDLTTKQEWTLDPVPWTITVIGARFSADGTKLVVHGTLEDRCVHRPLVWDVATRQLVFRWNGDSITGSAYELAPDARSLVVCHDNGRLSIMELVSQQERAFFQHAGWIRSAAFHPSGWQVVAASPEAPVYVWDLLGKPPAWDATKGDALWADLGDDAKKAFAVMRQLHANPREAVAFLRERLKVPTRPDEAKWQAWLRQLDSDEFHIREAAQKELTQRADVLLPQLETALKTANAETKQRLEAIIKSATTWTPERLRYVRACEVLEGLRTPDAKALLDVWAKASSARLANEAKDSRRRLAAK